MATQIKVVNKHHKVPYDISIDRGSKWGNPFSHMDNTKAIYVASSREDAIEMHRMWIQTQQHLMDDLHELDGKTLGCWCEPAPCHGHTLRELRQEQYQAQISVK